MPVSAIVKSWTNSNLILILNHKWSLSFMCTELFRESVAVWKWHFISRSLLSQWGEILLEGVSLFFMKLLQQNCTKKILWKRRCMRIQTRTIQEVQILGPHSLHVYSNCFELLNSNWHEAGHFPPPHCVFEWILRGHLKPTPNATIRNMFEVISFKYLQF